MESFGEIKWIRPEDYIKEYMLDLQIRFRVPNKHPIKLRRKLAEKYFLRQAKKINKDQKNIDIKENESKEGEKQTNGRTRRSVSQDSSPIVIVNEDLDEFADEILDKEFFKYMEPIYDLKLFNIAEQELSANEMKDYKKELETKLKEEAATLGSKYKKGNSTSNNFEIIVGNKIKKFEPSDMLMNEKYPKYSKWIASIFQVIKDMNLKDPYTNETIFKKIYPQRDGIPIYNPYGRYWVKIFYMGKYRKIEIDDTMPCGKYEEFLLPQCQSLRELWPAILTKALLKTFSYKFTCIEFMNEEIGDCSIFKALTRYIGEIVELDLRGVEYFGYSTAPKLIQNLEEKDIDGLQIIKCLLSNEVYENSQKYLVGFNKSEQLTEFKVNPLRVKEVDDESSISWFKNLTSDIKHLQGNALASIFAKKLGLNNEKKNIPNANPNAEGIVNVNANDINKKEEKIVNEVEKNEEDISNNINNQLTCLPSVEVNKLNVKNSKNKGKLTKRNTTLPNEITKDRSSNLTTEVTSKNLSLNTLDSMKNDNISKNENFDNGKISLIMKNILFKSLIPSVINSKQNNYQHRFNSIIKSYINLPNLTRDSDRIKNEINSDADKVKSSSGLYIDYAYSIVEYFYNDKYNMSRIKPIDFSDLRRKIQEAKVSYKTLSKEAKKNYVSNLIDVKNKYNEEKNKRMEQLKNPGKNFYLIKLKTNCFDNSGRPLNLFFPFKNYEIEMAKKCILNNWMFPPPPFFEDTYDENKEINSSQISEVTIKYNQVNAKSDPSSSLDDSFWTKNFYTTKILNSNMQIYDNCCEPLKRSEGLWIDMREFRDMFKYFIVLHNTKFYPYSIEIDNNWHNFEQDIYQPDFNTFVFHLTPGNQSKNISSLSNNKFFSKNEFNTNTNSKSQSCSYSCFLINFEPNSFCNLNLSKENNVNKLGDLKYYLMIDLVDSKGESILRDQRINLNYFFSAYQYDKILSDNEYFIIIKGVLAPFGYYLKISSEHSINSISYENYLKNFRDYTSFNFSNIQFPGCEENKFYIITKFKINIDNLTKFQITSNKFPDVYLKQFIDLYLIFEDGDYNNITETDNKKRIFFNLDIILNYSGTYYIIMSLKPSFNIQEFLFDVEILTNNKSSKVEIIDSIEPYEVVERYVPLKHGLILKELIYVPIDTIVYASFEVNLKIKEGDEYKSLNLENNKFRFEIYRFDKLILRGDYNDTALIQNVILNNLNSNITINNSVMSYQAQNNPSQTGNNQSNIQNNNRKTNNIVAVIENNPFSILCFIESAGPGSDTKSGPNSMIKLAENNSEIFWCVRVFSSDSIAFVKDTLKEDTDRMVIDSWEQNEPGRSEKSNKARVKFLLKLKKEKGDFLSVEEENLISEIRPRKNNKIVPLVVEPIDNKKEQKKNKEKSAITLPNLVLPELETPLIEANRILPTVETHKSIPYKQFLVNAYKDKVSVINSNFNYLTVSRSQPDILSLHQEINSNADEACIKIKKEIEEKLFDINKMKENLNKYYYTAVKKRGKRREIHFNELMNKRNNINDLISIVKGDDL